MITDDSKSLSQQRYSRFARSYVTSEVHAKGAELYRLVEIAQPQPDWLMLDVATGGGHTALKFASLVAQVVATDITLKMLVEARAFLTGQDIENVIFECADAENLPFNNGVFHLVTCRIAPHHFPDCPQFLQESARVLKLNGILLVQDHLLPEDEPAARYVDEFEKLRDPSHNRAYSESAWINMFQKAGLKVLHKERIIKQHEFLKWTERQQCSPEVVQRLIRMVDEAPSAVTEWMRFRNFGTPEAMFVGRQIIIAGRKSRV